MKLIKLRIWLANKLVKLAIRIRPKEANQLLQSMEDSFIFGTGITRIDPKVFFDNKP